MNTDLAGIVHGNIVTLDRSVPPLEGKRVRVQLEPIASADIQLTAEEQQRLLQEWAERGPQGPLEGNDTWPDDTA